MTPLTPADLDTLAALHAHYIETCSRPSYTRERSDLEHKLARQLADAAPQLIAAARAGLRPVEVDDAMVERAIIAFNLAKTVADSDRKGDTVWYSDLWRAALVAAMSKGMKSYNDATGGNGDADK